MRQKRIRRIIYSEQKLVRKDNWIQYIDGRYYRYWGYLSAKDVVGWRYVPNSWVDHFLRDDFLLISYHEPIVQVSESKQFWERYKGYDETIGDGAILHFLKAVKKHSNIDITEIAQQIQEKADAMPIKIPERVWQF